MNLKRLSVLALKEIRYAPKNFLFMFAIGVPIILSLILSLAFGTVFAGKPKFGIADLGDSQFAELASSRNSLVVLEFASSAALVEAASRGAVDLGVVLPADFDQRIQQGEGAELEAYIWGESLLKERAILGASVATMVREIAGQQAPVELVSTVVGDEGSISWEARLLPFVVLMSVLLAGTFVPATSIVEERMNRTLGALVVSPSSLGEILLAKALLGVVVSVIMAVVALLINNAFGAQPGLLVAILSLGAIAAAAIGVLLGALFKDMNTLFASIKAMGLVLYAPAILSIFPQVPEWVGRIFPTYYIINPVIGVTQEGAGFMDVLPDLAILILIIAVLVVIISGVTRRVRMAEA